MAAATAPAVEMAVVVVMMVVIRLLLLDFGAEEERLRRRHHGLRVAQLKKKSRRLTRSYDHR